MHTCSYEGWPTCPPSKPETAPITPGTWLNRCSTPQKQPPAKVAFSISPSNIFRTHHDSPAGRFFNRNASAPLVAPRDGGHHAAAAASGLSAALHRKVCVVFRLDGYNR